MNQALTSETAERGVARRLVDEDAAWLREFERVHGRPLRILHIGNIANNAYINAKIQRQAGIEADVVSYDYYHVMGCPEWEDADFVGDVGDESFPDWRAVDLRGFRRPQWFAQGRTRSCLRYLLAVRRGHSTRARLWWHALSVEQWLLCRRTVAARGARLAIRPVKSLRRLLRVASFFGGVVVSKLRALPQALADLALGRGLPAAISRVFPRRAVGWFPAAGLAVDDSPTELHSRLAACYAELRLSREDLSPEDYEQHLGGLDGWRSLMLEYDVVQAYSTDPVIPLLCDVPYAAYEHGTLREIPFEDTAQGRLCALSYAEAAAVFITNIDNVEAARRLGLTEDRIVCLPHAVDSERLRRYVGSNPTLRPPADVVRIFAPSRQDWVDGDPSWTKGNDRLFRAFRRVLETEAHCRLMLIEWGRDLQASRDLIHELDLDEHVEWIPTLRKQALWAEFLGSHVVADQFVLPAFGSVTFEALALGRRVITSLDTSSARAFFGESPPVLAASTSDEIEGALLRILEDPDDSAGLSSAGSDWFFARHGSKRILSLEIEAYRKIIDEATRQSLVLRPHARADSGVHSLRKER